MVEKNIEISILSQIYKDILTEKQFEILDSPFFILSLTACLVIL